MFSRVNGLFVLLFENEGNRKENTGYYFPKVEIKYYNVMIDGNNYFDYPVKSDMRTYDKIGKIATDQGDDYTNGCLLDYNYFNKHYKMVTIDLSKQQTLGVDPKAIQQIDFTGNLDWDEGAKIFFIIKEAKENILNFSQRTVRVLWMSSYDLSTACSTILFCLYVKIKYQDKTTQYNTLNAKLSNAQLNKLKLSFIKYCWLF